VNIPIGAAVTVAALLYLTEAKRGERDENSPRLDVGGAITVTAGLGALIYAIVGTDTHAWGSTYTVSILAVAAVLLAVFAVIQLRVAHTPLVPFRLFRSRSVTGSNIVMFLVGAAFFSMWYFLSLYLQNVLGYGALKTGLAFLPMAICIIIGAQASSRLLPKLGVRPLLLVGTLLMSGGFAWLSRISDTSHYWDHVFGPGCIISLAIGVLFTPLASAATSGVHYTEAGLASGVLNTARQMGGSVGLAALATIAIDRTRSLLGSAHGSSTAAALTSGYGRAYALDAILGLCAFAAAFIVPSLGPRPSAESPAESPAEQIADAVVEREEAAHPVLDPAATARTIRPEPA
jgi:predicted MFS family arabinose efflux permease